MFGHRFFGGRFFGQHYFGQSRGLEAVFIASPRRAAPIEAARLAIVPAEGRSNATEGS
jgi:hypothetical protein